MNSISIFSSPNPGYPFKEVMVTLKGGNLKMHKEKTGQVKSFLNNDTIKILESILLLSGSLAKVNKPNLISHKHIFIL